jgi:hypothetical protein
MFPKKKLLPIQKYFGMVVRKRRQVAMEVGRRERKHWASFYCNLGELFLQK